MTPIEIVTVILGYIYLFTSIFVNVIKVTYIFLKKQILPNVLLYYLLKVLSGVLGILYGLTFLDKVSYYMITPFLAVISLDLLVLGVVCVLTLKQHLNKLIKVHPIDPKPVRKLPKSKKTLKKTQNIGNKRLVKSRSMPTLLLKPNLRPPRRHRSTTIHTVSDLDEIYMANYINLSLKGRNPGSKPPIVELWCDPPSGIDPSRTQSIMKHSSYGRGRPRTGVVSTNKQPKYGTTTENAIKAIVPKKELKKGSLGSTKNVKDVKNVKKIKKAKKKKAQSEELEELEEGREEVEEYLDDAEEDDEEEDDEEDDDEDDDEEEDDEEEDDEEEEDGEEEDDEEDSGGLVSILESLGDVLGI